MGSDGERISDLEDRVSGLEQMADRHSAVSDLEDRVSGLEQMVGGDFRTYSDKTLVERSDRLEEAVGDSLAGRVGELEEAVSGGSSAYGLEQRVFALEMITGYENIRLIKWKEKRGVPATLVERVERLERIAGIG